ncbi:methyltransferase domain-containing protein [Candidatus Woesearchaeota archaeon]|nr:methyltransferase domain-containing protein [Candidatus Woesearchaeota archaeon]
MAVCNVLQLLRQEVQINFYFFIFMSTKIQDFYRLHSGFYDLTRWFFLFNRKKAVKAMKLKQGDTVIYVGCGTGHNFSQILRRISKTGRLIGIDYSPDMLNQARKKIRKNNWKNIKVVQADATNYKLNTKANAILYSFSLSMFPDWRQSLKASYKHLKNRGRIAIIDFSEFNGVLRLLNPVFNWWLYKHSVNNKQEIAQFLKKMHWKHSIKETRTGYNKIIVIFK